MKLFLDTHTLLWFLDDDPSLSATAKTTLEDPANERWLSPISLLEIAVKVSIGKLKLPAPFSQAEVLCTLDRHFRHPDVEAYCTAHGVRIVNDTELLQLLRTPPATA